LTGTVKKVDLHGRGQIEVPL
jgi:hypothetical protein